MNHGENLKITRHHFIKNKFSEILSSSKIARSFLKQSKNSNKKEWSAQTVKKKRSKRGQFKAINISLTCQTDFIGVKQEKGFQAI